MQETWEMRVQSLGQKDALDEGMATHFTVLARRTTWTEEPGGLPSTGWQRIRNDWSNLAHMCLFVTRWTTWTTRLLCPWSFPGKNTGVSCHFLLQEIFPAQRWNLNVSRLSCIGKWVLYHCTTWEVHVNEYTLDKHWEETASSAASWIPSGWSRFGLINKNRVEH